MQPQPPSVQKPAQKLPDKLVIRQTDTSSPIVIKFIQVSPEEYRKMIWKELWKFMIIQGIILLIVIIAGHVLGINACQSESMKWACYTADH